MTCIRKVIFIGLPLIFIILMVFNFSNNFKKEYQPTEQDNIEIISIVNQYYESIITKDFYTALQFCDLENSKFGFQTRIIVLNEIWDSIIEEFKFGYKATEVNRYKNNNDDTGFVVNVSINLKYKDTIGGAVGEYVYVEKVNDEWKIKKIHGLDRYGIYRVDEYQYDRLIDFLDPDNNR